MDNYRLGVQVRYLYEPEPDATFFLFSLSTDVSSSFPLLGSSHHFIHLGRHFSPLRVIKYVGGNVRGVCRHFSSAVYLTVFS